MKTKLILFTFLTALMLAYFGLLSYSKVLSMFLPRIDNFHISALSIHDAAFDSILFAMLCGLIPILLSIIWLRTKTPDYPGRLLSVAILVTCAVSELTIRYVMVGEMAVQMTHIGNNGPARMMDFRELKYNLYLFAGEAAGFVVAFFYLKKRQARIEAVALASTSE